MASLASRFRATVTISGLSFDAIGCTVVLTTMKDRAGIPEIGSLSTSITAFVDMSDDINLPYSTLKQLFELANIVTQDKIRDIKVEYWKDDSKNDALCVYTFKGWISHFQTGNSIANVIDETENPSVGAFKNVNHLLTIQIEPAFTGANTKEIQMSN